MGTITFIKTANTEEYVFSKDTFKYMYTSYTSGVYGAILLYFAAENALIDNDTITITATKQFMGNIVKHLAQEINKPGYSEIKLGLTKGPLQSITAITYTAG